MEKIIKSLVKEAILELVAEGKVEIKGVDLAKAGSDKTVTNVVDMSAKKAEKADKKAVKAEPKVEAQDSDQEAIIAEVEALSYNDLKKKAKELGVQALGKKDEVKQRVIEAMLASEGDAEPRENDTEAEEAELKKVKNSDKLPEKMEDDSEYEESEEEEAYSEEEIAEFIDFLKGLDKEEILAIADDMGYEEPKKFVKNKFIKMLAEDTQSLVDTLEDRGYYDEEEPEDAEDADVEDTVEEDEEAGNELVDALSEYTVEELAEICSDLELSTKGKKQALIDRIVKAYDNGEIVWEDIFGEEDGEDAEDVEDAEVDSEDEVEEDWYTEEELAEMSDAELKEIASDNDLEVPTKKVKNSKTKKTTTKLDREALIADILALGEEDGEEDGEDSDREAIEDEIEEEIRADFEAKKLKEPAIKKFLTSYNKDNDDWKYNKKSALDEYISIKRALVDDEGEVHELEDVYIRDGENFCCGEQIMSVDGLNYCSVCGAEYEA